MSSLITSALLGMQTGCIITLAYRLHQANRRECERLLQAEADLRGAEQKAPLRRQEMISYLAALSLVSLALGTILLSRAQRSRSAP